MDRKKHKKHKRFHSPLPEKTTLGMALVKALAIQREELKKHGIYHNGDWIKILEQNGKIRFSSAGAEIIFQPVKEKKPTKRIYLGE